MSDLNQYFDFTNTTNNTRKLSAEELETMLQEIWISVANAPPTRLVMAIPVYKKMKHHLDRYFGVKIKGCKGTRTVRFRNDRWQVI